VCPRNQPASKKTVLIRFHFCTLHSNNNNNDTNEPVGDEVTARTPIVYLHVDDILATFRATKNSYYLYYIFDPMSEIFWPKYALYKWVHEHDERY